MNPEDIITIILVFIFFVIPLLKKIFGGGEEVAQRRKRSAQEIREYLEKMRQAEQESSPEYRAPATRPSRSSQQERRQRQQPQKHTRKHLVEDGPGINKRHRIQEAIAQDIDQHVAEHIDQDIAEHVAFNIGSSKTTAVAPKNRQVLIHKRIMENQDLSDFQKAIILTEIFGKASAYKNKLSKKTLSQ